MRKPRIFFGLIALAIAAGAQDTCAVQPLFRAGGQVVGVADQAFDSQLQAKPEDKDTIALATKKVTVAVAGMI